MFWCLLRILFRILLSILFRIQEIVNKLITKSDQQSIIKYVAKKFIAQNEVRYSADPRGETRVLLSFLVVSLLRPSDESLLSTTLSSFPSHCSSRIETATDTTTILFFQGLEFTSMSLSILFPFISCIIMKINKRYSTTWTNDIWQRK